MKIDKMLFDDLYKSFRVLIMKLLPLLEEEEKK
jgi:hypothetical protein